MSITFYCTECTQKLRIDDDYAGKLVACTRCGARLRVPQPEAAAAPPPTRPRVEPPAPEPPPPAAGPESEPEPDESPYQELAGKEFAVDEYADQVTGDDGTRSAATESEFAATGEEESAGPPAEEPESGPSVALQSRRRPRSARQAARPAGRKQPEPSLVRPAMKIDFEELIDMTAMVDIVFFLLIFFLVTSMKAIDSSIPMPAPDPQKAGARESRPVSEIEADDEYIVVHIDRNDVITVNDAEVRNDRELLFKLRDLRTSGSRPDKMLVVGHGDASHGTAVMVLDAGRDVGIEQVRLSVADESE